MSHELTITNGKVEMAFREGTEFPWHFQETQPQQVKSGASVLEWSEAAGMTWTVERAPVSFQIDDEMVAFPGKEALYRSDNRFPLGVVTPDYCILNPGECIEFFSDLVQSVGLELDTAGTLFGGRRFWALAKAGEACMVDTRDTHKGYLLLTSSADGLRATEARFTDVRVVCNNTLRMSEKDSAGQIKVTHRSQWNADSVKERLGVAPATFEAFMAKMRKLADQRLSDDQAQAEVKLALGKQKADEGKEGKVFARTMELFRGLALGSDLPGVEGTAYGLLNAYTEALDHRSKAQSDSHRLTTALMGPGDAAKTKFRDQLYALVA